MTEELMYIYILLHVLFIGLSLYILKKINRNIGKEAEIPARREQETEGLNCYKNTMVDLPWEMNYNTTECNCSGLNGHACRCRH